MAIGASSTLINTDADIMKMKMTSILNFLRRLAGALALGACLLPAVGHAADPNKVLRLAFEAGDDGFDRVRTSSLYSTWVVQGIYEGLLTFDYLADPAMVVPQTAEALPEISNDGKTYTFKIKKGIYFTDDPAFKGKKRELVAQDFAYTLRRYMDPKNRSPDASDIVEKVLGAQAYTSAAMKSGKFDYDAPIPGIEVPDRYTLRIHLVHPDPNFIYTFALTYANAREVIEFYGNDTGSHPVGTGPYMLQQYVPRSKIVLVANPDYRGFIWDFKSTGTDWDNRLVKEMKGKKMPQIGRVEISIIEEDQSRWLAFDSAQLDIIDLADTAAPKVLEKNLLKKDFADRGIRLFRYPEGITFTYFNMKDPVVGGYTKEKIALRRAIAMSYNAKEEIAQVRFGQAMVAQSVIPPGKVGFNPNYRSSIAYDPELAAKLLDHFGYKRGADGWRRNPDGSPLVIKIHSAPNARDKARMEIWKRSLDRIGLRGDYPVSSFADNLKAAYRCELPMWGLGRTGGSPDGLGSLESFYGPLSGSGNLGCYKSDVFDNAYRDAQKMVPGPERDKLMETIQRQLEADTPLALHLWRVRNWVTQPWLKGFKKHQSLYADWMYLDIER